MAVEVDGAGRCNLTLVIVAAETNTSSCQILDPLPCQTRALAIDPESLTEALVLSSPWVTCITKFKYRAGTSFNMDRRRQCLIPAR
ncbi:hypothetical protein RRG08_064130 [Elysia crispata]|uniref:Uncharacterized protein n=1 Tax=Elysia crispata TaxID=231223 RepID=A0AAE0ZN18_9GAST|nr:hypothetical protein RRG08_064130 [Elysia crispata]